MPETLELPDAVSGRLLEAARTCGVTPADRVTSRLPRPNGPGSADETRRSAALRRMLSHSIDLGHPTATNNGRIDAALAREYGDSQGPGPSRRCSAIPRGLSVSGKCEGPDTTRP
jgi:hypothetical protein